MTLWSPLSCLATPQPAHLLTEPEIIRHLALYHVFHVIFTMLRTKLKDGVCVYIRHLAFYHVFHAIFTMLGTKLKDGVCVCVCVCVYMCTYVLCPLNIPPRPALRLYYHRYERFLIRIATLLTPRSKAHNPVCSVSYIIYSLLGRVGLAYHS